MLKLCNRDRHKQEDQHTAQNNIVVREVCTKQRGAKKEDWLILWGVFQGRLHEGGNVKAGFWILIVDKARKRLGAGRQETIYRLFLIGEHDSGRKRGSRGHRPSQEGPYVLCMVGTIKRLSGRNYRTGLVFYMDHYRLSLLNISVGEYMWGSSRGSKNEERQRVSERREVFSWWNKGVGMIVHCQITNNFQHLAHSRQVICAEWVSERMVARCVAACYPMQRSHKPRIQI